MKKRIAILGATGSIGKQVLEVLGDEYEIVLVSADKQGALLSEQFSQAENIKIVSNSQYEISPLDKRTHVFSTKCLSDPATYESVDVVVNGIGGIWGIEPSFAVLKSNAKLITANKETFVACGYLFMQRAKELGKQVGIDIIPIDSEHSAIWQCLKGEKFSSLDRITLTASGGAFRNLSKEEIASLKASDALNHPTWKMGKKVTIDSATLMNKGFEIIEAKHLFNCSNIDVVIHTESIIHSMVTFKDGSSKLQFSVPDMRLPISYALTEPNRKTLDLGLKVANIFALQGLSFTTPDYDKFPCLKIASEVAKKSDDYQSAIMCISDEICVELYLKNLISFYQISDIITLALEHFNEGEINHPSVILSIYAQVREYILSIIGG